MHGTAMWVVSPYANSVTKLDLVRRKKSRCVEVWHMDSRCVEVEGVIKMPARNQYFETVEVYNTQTVLRGRKHFDTAKSST